MLAALAALVLAAGNAPISHEGRPVVALIPLHPLGVPPDLVRALQVTLRNELAALPEARLVSEKELAEQLKREPDCDAKIACAALAASRAGARELIMGTASQLGDAYMIDLKLLDARSAAELRRSTHPVAGSPDALIETLRETAVQLLAPARFVGAMKIDVPGVAGAMLFVDGKQVGSTPLLKPIEGLTPGPHTVRVVAAGKGAESSAFVDVRFGQVTNARIELKQLQAVPIEALPNAAAPNPARKAWMRPVALGTAGLGVASAVVGVVFHAKAYATAGDLNRRESLNQLQPGDRSGYDEVDRDTRLARGFYITGAILAVAGAGLFFWDLHLQGTSVTGDF
ncbi:MAG: hypothetical protein ABR567_04595 [Myxococcales bacterium]|nr:PEGA domain-containing protein [Myxococcales bacterium]